MRTIFSSVMAVAISCVVFSCKKEASVANDPQAPAVAEKTDPAEAAPAAEPALLAAGSSVPDFAVTAHDGTELSSAKLAGAPYVVYFYPRDETPGCTIEAQSFRDAYDELAQLDAVVVGVSTDSNDSHAGFAENHKLPFPLVADESGELAAKFGVNISAGFAPRVTFVVGPDGKVARVYPSVKVDGHSDEVLADIRKLSE